MDSAQRGVVHFLSRLTSSLNNSTTLLLAFLEAKFRWVQRFGGDAVLIAIVGIGGHSKEEGEEDAESSIRRNERFCGLMTLEFARFKDRFLRLVFQPKDVLTPLFLVNIVTTGLLHVLQSMEISVPGVEDFQNSCPDAGRRTQRSAFVKLLAATITTVGIHGHLGSLSGSESWRAELFRAIEVILSPLASIFSLGLRIWLEIATRASPLHTSRDSPFGIKQSLASICMVRVTPEDGSASSSSSPQLAVRNPMHLEVVSMKRDLKWAGRVAVLIILLAQYIQAFVLLSRRLLTNTAAIIDYAMLFMILSGIGALSQSITISLINTSWIMKRSSPPCVAVSCLRHECMELKRNRNLQSRATRTVVLGFDITGIPRTILNNLGAGHVQLSIFNKGKAPDWKVYTGVFGIYAFWHISIAMAVCLNFVKVLQHDGKPLHAASETESDAPASQTLPVVEATIDSDPATTQSSRSMKPFSSRMVSCLIKLSLHSIMFGFGCAAIAVTVFSFVFQLFYLLCPSIFMYISMFAETKEWKSWGDAPCPLMWKDGLEDEVWWF